MEGNAELEKTDAPRVVARAQNDRRAMRGEPSAPYLSWTHRGIEEVSLSPSAARRVVEGLRVVQIEEGA